MLTEKQEKLEEGRETRQGRLEPVLGDTGLLRGGLGLSPAGSLENGMGDF